MTFCYYHFFFFLFLRTIYESFQVIFAAGTDTSSTPVKWAMSEMMRQPKVLEKAQAEIRQAFRGKKKIHEKDIQNPSYLEPVIKESLKVTVTPSSSFDTPKRMQRVM